MVRVLDRYELLVRLGQGGGANVFLARDHGAEPAGKLIALKTLLPRLTSDARAVEAFMVEAEIASRLNHPNIVTVTGFGETDGVYGIAMEFVFGVSLADLLEQQMKVKRAAAISVLMEICARVCDGLQHAHDLRGADGQLLNVVHRDVSPENILISFDGIPKLTDFGIAKATNRGFETERGLVKGKMSYLSPEQVLERRLDRRADLFALGAVMWESMTGRRLFDAPSFAETVEAIKNAVIEPPSTHVPGLPASVDAVVLRALRRIPSHRYQSAQEMGAAIDGLLEQSAQLRGAPRIARELLALFGAAIPARALALRGALSGNVDPTHLARVLGGRPIAVDDLPSAVRTSKAPVVPPPRLLDLPPMRLDDSLSGGDVAIEIERDVDLGEILRLDRDVDEPSEPAVAPKAGWKQAGETFNDANDLLLELSEQDVLSGRISAGMSSRLGLTASEAQTFMGEHTTSEGRAIAFQEQLKVELEAAGVPRANLRPEEPPPQPARTSQPPGPSADRRAPRHPSTLRPKSAPVSAPRPSRSAEDDDDTVALERIPAVPQGPPGHVWLPTRVAVIGAVLVSAFGILAGIIAAVR